MGRLGFKKTFEGETFNPIPLKWVPILHILPLSLFWCGIFSESEDGEGNRVKVDNALSFTSK